MRIRVESGLIVFSHHLYLFLSQGFERMPQRPFAPVRSPAPVRTWRHIEGEVFLHVLIHLGASPWPRNHDTVVLQGVMGHKSPWIMGHVESTWTMKPKPITHLWKIVEQGSNGGVLGHLSSPQHTCGVSSQDLTGLSHRALRQMAGEWWKRVLWIQYTQCWWTVPVLSMMPALPFWIFSLLLQLAHQNSS